MLKNREIRLSIRDRLSSMLTTPDVATGLTAYNVYNESQFRAVPAGTFTPTFPFVYIIDAFAPPSPMRADLQQPFIVIETDLYESNPFELGNRSGRNVDLLIHIFGQNRGQRDDLGGYIADYFGSSVAIKTYPSGATVENALVNPIIQVRDVFTPRIEKVEQVELAGAVLGWSSVSISIKCKL